MSRAGGDARTEWWLEWGIGAKAAMVQMRQRAVRPANPKITLTTYAHLFQQADHAAKAREALEASYLPAPTGSRPDSQIANE